ncbi:PLP-dependent aminotransferase family protein [Piscinibacter koreensis]|uniref:PLP-dependent aminotransferase family protein n=1 Tax=Piscinibacter koreensis TaxID=2742824 RepID=A0A7Y6NJ74_9BURK|nr:PLP-dependent aminotransferase family protein [Schlegelella koreensis]NUZ04178.1 PLP-dependent aminotransferase family protein [Schlegelella koreensis]
MTSPLEPPAAATLSRSAQAGLADQLAERFAGPIRQRLLAPGARLPSVRECARRHGVSAHTVVAAYDQLLALGLVEARPQRGFFVRSRGAIAEAGAARDLPAAEVMRHPLPISATSLIRGMFQPPGARPMPGLGTLPAEWLDPMLLARALRQVTSAGQLETTALHYGDPAGDPRLRRALAARLGEHGIGAGVAQIVTSVGATHALDIVTRTLLRAGDRVLVDEPGWSVEYARLAALGLVILPVPRGDDGPDLAAMERLIKAQPAGAKPRLYVTVSVLHNPTGATLTPGAAHRLLQLATRHDLHVLEDDTYAHLAPPHLPRLAALDGLERTIYVSGFSKILVPNWRVGFLAAPERLIERLVDTKLLTTLTSPGLTEQALAHALESGQLRRHAERVVAKLDAARARVVKLAESHGCRFAATPRGLFGWVDAGCDTERLAEALLDRWLVAPGALFHADHRPTTLMRVNFATSQDAAFWRALVEAREQLATGIAPDAAAAQAPRSETA